MIKIILFVSPRGGGGGGGGMRDLGITFSVCPCDVRKMLKFLNGLFCGFLS